MEGVRILTEAEVSTENGIVVKGRYEGPHEGRSCV